MQNDFVKFTLFLKIIFPLLARPLPIGRGYARGGGWVVRFKYSAR